MTQHLLAKARAVESDKAWWEEWDAFHGAPIDRSPEGQARHDRLYREFEEKLAAARADHLAATRP